VSSPANNIPISSPPLVTSWLTDIGISYLGGVVAGTPVGLPLAWISGVEGLLTATIVTSMVVVLALRRARARQAAERAKLRSEFHAT
jgi:hypothetical protein